MMETHFSCDGCCSCVTS